MVPLTMPMHPVDGLAEQRLAQRAHDGDAAGDGRLEEQVDARRRRRRRRARRRRSASSALLAGDDRLAGREGLEHERAGGLDAAHDLDDDVDVGVGDDRRRRRW